ncbi:MAG: exosortase F-associated protein [Flavobacteriaceae bacterium]|jgi:exosortase F-associated protein|uniref:exosortase F system-associated membrane protein n=1 Tax=Candidatus Marifrigoribacter sp. Uisw_064 TaxID=3230970 RepID=UPI003AE6918B
MSKFNKIVGVLFCIILLMLIRWFENSLFYDPLIIFFKTDHTSQSLPKFDGLLLIGNIALRFIMNTVLSLAILWFVFSEKEIVKISTVLYSFLFLLLLLVFTYLLFYADSESYLSLFYVRRFLIQPLFLLLLLPAFYFQKKQ